MHTSPKVLRGAILLHNLGVVCHKKPSLQLEMKIQARGASGSSSPEALSSLERQVFGTEFAEAAVPAPGQSSSIFDYPPKPEQSSQPASTGDEEMQQQQESQLKQKQASVADKKPRSDAAMRTSLVESIKRSMAASQNNSPVSVARQAILILQPFPTESATGLLV